MLPSTELREQLLNGQLKKFWIISHRPPKVPEIDTHSKNPNYINKDAGKQYAWQNTYFENENKMWRFVNRLINGKWEYEKHEFLLPARFLTPSIYPLK